ncbi:cytochrome c [Ornithinibacillus gellani]|uniref:cytochrome c551 n=1 Tax=Ornithinibacillus gellani TaxID=2293253 RepID=UPI000F47DF85|nr:cytochrome c [Ornithinibacillus gellani]TQS74818.1 cytochrome c [Ornithinibacillus gellani]
MKKWLLAIVFGSVLVLGACGGGDDSADKGTDDNADSGTVDSSGAEDIYKSNCSSCHGQDLGGGAGPDLTKVGSDHSADEIVDIIHNGTGSMPAQKQVSDEDAKTLADWLSEKK